MKNTIQELRNQLDLIEQDALLESEILEALMLEASPLINTFGRDQQGVALAKYLHKNYKVSDQAELVPYTHPVGGLDLKTFKTHYDNFMILKGPNGWAAVKPDEKSMRSSMDRMGSYYRPSTDQSIRYIGIFSLKDGDNIEEKEIIATRGGNYKRKEKAEVTTKTIADQLKDQIGHKDITVFRLMERDPDTVANVPSARLMGRRSSDIPTKASVQRRKVDVRAANKRLPGFNDMIDQLYTKFSKLGPKLIQQIKIRKIRAGDKQNKTVQDWQNDPSSFNRALKYAISSEIGTNRFLSSIKSEIEQQRQKTGDNSSDELVAIKAALGGNPTILSALLKSVKNRLEDINQEPWPY